MWTALIAPLAELGRQWLKNKAEVKQAAHEATLKHIEKDANWETTMAQGSLTSWKDEWFTIVLSLPVLTVIYGVAMSDITIIERTQMALDTLSGLPEWYQYLLYIAVLSSFGIRGVDKLMEMRK